MDWFFAVTLLACLQSCITLPRRNLEGHFIGEGSNDLATSILKGYEHDTSNFVFSPLGYSTILAILAEGAVGKTREEIISTLKFPVDNTVVRETFKTVLQRMTDKETLNKPEFKTYFYIYKNISVHDEYRKVLLENYLTEVKSVERPEEEGTIEISYESSTETSEGSSGDEDLLAEDKRHSTTLYPLLPQETTTEKEQAQQEKLHSRSEVVHPQPEKESEKIIKKQVQPEDEIKEKVDAARRAENERILRLAKKFLGINLRQKRFSQPQELMGISANQLGSKNGNDIQSKMIVFNGLYFKGSFVTPFQTTKNQTDGVFYTSEKEKLPAEMMNALGNFQYGELTDLDAKAIELPYEGGRYSLLILLPRTRGGLSKLVADLSGYSLRNLHKQMSVQPVSVRLPKFDFRAISKPVSILKKSGISSIFSTDADLSRLSPDEGLFLNELVQLVTIKVDEDSSSTNLLTASALSLRSIYSVKFYADHPFLFFLRDHQENIIISAGKIANPSERYKN
nr:PREDICTED: serpin B5-like [Bemisia tabaci]